MSGGLFFRHYYYFDLHLSSCSCSGWSARCPSSRSCAARAWTTSSSAATASPASPRPSSPRPPPSSRSSPLPPSPSALQPTSTHRAAAPTCRCRRTHPRSAPRHRWPPGPCPILRPRPPCSRSRLTVSRSTSSAGPPAASDANTWSKVSHWVCSDALRGPVWKIWLLTIFVKKQIKVIWFPTLRTVLMCQ